MRRCVRCRTPCACRVRSTRHGGAGSSEDLTGGRDAGHQSVLLTGLGNDDGSEDTAGLVLSRAHFSCLRTEQLRSAQRSALRSALRSSLLLALLDDPHLLQLSLLACHRRRAHREPANRMASKVLLLTPLLRSALRSAAQG